MFKEDFTGYEGYVSAEGRTCKFHGAPIPRPGYFKCLQARAGAPGEWACCTTARHCVSCRCFEGRNPAQDQVSL